MFSWLGYLIDTQVAQAPFLMWVPQPAGVETASAAAWVKLSGSNQKVFQSFLDSDDDQLSFHLMNPNLLSFCSISFPALSSSFYW